tara:strand:+ start:568 stop:723 length:156 start_codon:yes stop_codon:yes gene_type:complete
MDWIRHAERWKDRCNLCGETDQRLVSFSICISCKVKEDKSKEVKNVKKEEG